jgi:ArsR family transcriptional regulator
MDEFVKIMKALTDKNRVRILKMLETKPMCVCEITRVLGLATSTVSAHLALLKEAGFITDIKSGKWVDYSLNKSSDNPILHQVLAMLSGWLVNDDTVITDKEIVAITSREIICAG